jgi:kynurenine--oxoglutarate transaminase/cysteine-S-conjugate beta-lyase/glutamine--phenylpyruvate transaminase
VEDEDEDPLQPCDDDDDDDDSRTATVTDNRRAGEAIDRLGGAASNPTVWTEFARIAAQQQQTSSRGLVNLGQGFPDWLPPTFCLESLVEAAVDAAQSPHQYTRSAGHPSLARQLASRYSVHLGRDVDPMQEVAVTVGASQALYVTLRTLVSPGDEVILFEPYFDLYLNQVKLAGGTPVFVPLDFHPYGNDDDGTFSDDEDDDVVFRGGEWKLNVEKLKSAVSSRTRAIILNSPHNPTGKVFTLEELSAVADVAQIVDECVVISDEVYKYIIHSPPGNTSTDDHEKGGDVTRRERGESPLCRGHVHVATLPGMWYRTVTISSAGKTFSATGWQVGWCIGPSHLIRPIHQLLPYVQFCASTVIQEALARSLPKADEPYQGYESYYEYLRQTYIRKRDALAGALSEAGFGVPDYRHTPGGGFFILARIGPRIRRLLPDRLLNVPNRAAPGGVARLDWALCQWMAEEHGFMCIPSSPFFSLEQVERGTSDQFVRVAFCKSDETIEAAAERIRSMAASYDRRTEKTDDQQQQEKEVAHTLPLRVVKRAR